MGKRSTEGRAPGRLVVSILRFTPAFSGFLFRAEGSLDASAAGRIGLCCCWIMDSDRKGGASEENYLCTLRGSQSSEFTVCLLGVCVNLKLAEESCGALCWPLEEYDSKIFVLNDEIFIHSLIFYKCIILFSHRSTRQTQMTSPVHHKPPCLYTCFQTHSHL